MADQRPDFYLGTDIDGVHLSAEQLDVRSKNLNSLIGSVTYTDALFHILLGRFPDEQERKLFDLVLVSFHGGFGLLPPTTFVPRIVAGTGVSTAQALAAGFLASGPYHVGAIEQAMRNYDSIARQFEQSHANGSVTAGELEQFAWQCTADQIDAGETVGGFGHPLLRKDPRPVHVRRQICELEANGIFFDIYDGVVRCLKEKKGVPPNVDGITGAILLHLGFQVQHGTGLFLLARAAAMLAHIIEEQTDMPYQTMKRFMPLPILFPRVFNANFKVHAKRFNRIRDSKAFNALKNIIPRRARKEAAAKEQADQAVIDEARTVRDEATVEAEIQQRGASVPPDSFAESASADGLDSDTSALPELLQEDCSSPELLAGATFFLSSCLQSMGNSSTGDVEKDARTEQLIQSALHLVQQASEAMPEESSD